MNLSLYTAISLQIPAALVWYHCKMQPRLYSFSTFSSQSFRSGRKRKNKSSARNRHRRSCHKRPLQSQSYFPCHLQRCPCAPCHRQPDNPDPFHQESPDNTLLLPRLLSESARSTHDIHRLSARQKQHHHNLPQTGYQHPVPGPLRYGSLQNPCLLLQPVPSLRFHYSLINQIPVHKSLLPAQR